MTLRTVEIPVFRDPSGDPIATTVTIRLIDDNGHYLIGLTSSAGDPVTDQVSVSVYDIATTVDLTPQDDIAPTSYYRVFVLAARVKKHFDAQVPSGVGTYSWSDFFQSSGPVSPAELATWLTHPADSSIHVPVADSNPDGSLLGLSGGEPAWLPAPSGTGDMQSLIYDPGGVSDNVFNLANMSGNLDGGTF